MTEFVKLLDEVLYKAPGRLAPESPTQVAKNHDCDACGEAKSDVDLWAEDSETGEEVWLCLSCGEW